MTIVEVSTISTQGTYFVYCSFKFKKHMDFDTFDTDIFSEIQDAPGEIFDVIEYKEEWEKEEKFDVESYIKGNTDY